MDFCTLITKNRLSDARALAGSIRAVHPDARLHVLLVDDPEDYFDPTAEPFDVVTLDEITIQDRWQLLARYDRDELLTLLKPMFIAELADRTGRVIHLDAETRLKQSAEQLVSLLDSHQVVLTPSSTGPLSQTAATTNGNLLKGGIYDAGCIAIARGEQSERFLAWWSNQLRSGLQATPQVDPPVDQRLIDMAPALFENIGVLPGEAIAAGSVGEAANELTTDDEIWPYSWAQTAGGLELTASVRALVDVPADADRGESLFTAAGERAWLARLATPADDEHGGSYGVTQMFARLWDRRPDLQREFSRLGAGEAPAFLNWIYTIGVADGSVPADLLSAVHATAAGVDSPTEHAAGVHEMESKELLGVSRGETVVCIPVYGAYDLFVRCLESVLRHTPAAATILIADDASPDPAIRDFVLGLDAAALRHRVCFLRQPQNLGFVGNVNTAIAVSTPGDVVVLNSDCVVARHWLESLKAAAYADTNVATASSLTNHGTILSVPFRNRPISDLPQQTDFTQAARRVREQSLKIRPRIATAIGHCVYIRRHAIELVGDLDMTFSPGYGEEVDFSQRCLAHGMVHVAADDVLVLHSGGGSFGPQSARQKENELILRVRYHYYDAMQDTAGSEPRGPLMHALAVASQAITGTSVTIDGRILGPVITGTQVHTLELIAALDRTAGVRVRVVMPPDPGRYAVEALVRMSGVELLSCDEIDSDTEHTTIAHRPFQVSSEEDLDLLRNCGDRIVITQQDLIAYRNPSYFPSFAQWEDYRRLTRLSLSTADLVLFFSAHAAHDAMADQLVDETRSQVVYIGVDHEQLGAGPEPVRPEALADLADGEFIVQLGTDYRHKNRRFAISLLDELRRRHGWNGRLVLAGPRVPHGSSLGDEAELLIGRPELAESVITLGAVEDAEKDWLMANATAVVYPTLYEGFGLLPFEAAQAGTPCLFASQASMAELLPAEIATLVPWDAEKSADRVIEVLSDAGARDQLVAEVLRASERFTWENCGRDMLNAYHKALFLPDRDASKMLSDTLTIRREYADVRQRYDEIWFALSDDERHHLLGPSGELSWSVQRTVLALSENHWLHRITFGFLHFGNRVGRRLRRVFGRGAPGPPQSMERYLRLWSEEQRAKMSDRARAALDQSSKDRDAE